MYHRGPYIQRGRGLGNFLGSLYKSMLPVVKTIGGQIASSPITKNVLKTAKRSAKEAGLNIATDVLSGKKKFAASLGENISTAKQAIADTLEQSLLEKNPPTKKRHAPVSVGRKKGKHSVTVVRRGKKFGDIFDQTF